MPVRMKLVRTRLTDPDKAGQSKAASLDGWGFEAVPGLPKPAVPDGPVRTLFEQLHALHHQAGWPSLREMAKEVGCSHTTISAAFSEPRVPRWGLLELIVETLGGDVAGFHDLWLAASVTGEPAPAPAAALPRSLPPDVAGFTGRESEVAALDELLDTAAGSTAIVISALSGGGGVGKTALAVHWAHRVAERFPDGQLYVNLRGYDPEHPAKPAEALEALLRQLGDSGASIPGAVADRAARLRTLLAGKKVLLLIDNAHSAAQVRDLLPGTPGCFVVVTSRDSLPALVARHGAQRLTVGLLSLADGVSLLRRLVGPRVDAEPQAAETLVRRCARLPLAIRVAAELAVARPKDSLADLAAELASESRPLDLLDAGDDEHTAIRSVFSWSLRHLTSADSHAFALLGEHPGQDIDVEAAAALFGVDASAARRTTDALARAHLLEERDRNRYGMHDLLRAYASEMLVQGRANARARLYEFYVDRAETATRQWLDAERGNCVAVAVAAAAESPRHTEALAAALSRYLDTSGHYRDAIALDELALRAARDRQDAKAETAVLGRLGTIHRRLAEYPQALAFQEEALRGYDALGDVAGKAQVLLGIGGIEWRLGRYSDALAHLTESLALHQEHRDRGGEAAALHNLGIVYRRLGRYNDAREHYEQALAVQIALKNDAGEAGARNNLGIVQLRLGWYPLALENFEQALAIYRRLGDRAGEGAVRNNLGETHERLGGYSEAVAQHQSALDIHQSTGYRAGHAVALRGLGVAAGQCGDVTRALSYLDQAIDLSTEIGEADVRTRALIDSGLLLHARGDTAVAADRLKAALDLAETTDNTYERARALDGLARVTGAPEHAALAAKLFAQLGVAEATER